MRFTKFLIAFFLLLAGGSAAQAAQGEDAMTMKIESPVFANNAEIPILYTGQGSDISPPLTFSGAPVGAKSLALIVDDPDAPDPTAPKMTFVHWVLYNIPPSAKGLPEDVKTLPAGTEEGLNDRRKTGYTGPMPPIGRHRYFFKLYALDDTLNFTNAPTKADVVKAMEGHILAQAALMGTYQAKK